MQPQDGRRTSMIPFSSIRTVTVGFGFAPNLLTPPSAGARGLMQTTTVPSCNHRRWGISPRPENVHRRDCPGDTIDLDADTTSFKHGVVNFRSHEPPLGYAQRNDDKEA